MALVADELEILVTILIERRRLALNLQSRQRKRAAGELRLDLFEVVEVEMTIPPGPDEVADAQIGLLGDEVREQRVRGDVERDPEEDVGAALIELAGESAVRDVELEQRMTRSKPHPWKVADIPRGDDQAP